MATGSTLQRRRGTLAEAFGPSKEDCGQRPLSGSPNCHEDSVSGGLGFACLQHSHGDCRDFCRSPGGRVSSEDDDHHDGRAQRGPHVELTLMEQVFLLGLRDQKGYVSFWNDNMSYVLRGCVLIELSLRGRIAIAENCGRLPLAERIVKLKSAAPTGQVLLDEALRLMASDSGLSVVAWIDLLSGESWNFAKVHYQLRQVRERLAKGLVDKGVLRTSKRTFVLFDMPTHPIADRSTKDELVRSLLGALFAHGRRLERHTVALVCCAFAASVLENALESVPVQQRAAAISRAEDMLCEHSKYTEAAAVSSSTEIMSAVFSVLAKMDSIV